MKVGDKVLIAPEVTNLSDWIPATVINVENNSFRGIVIVAETEDGNVYFIVLHLLIIQKYIQKDSNQII